MLAPGPALVVSEVQRQTERCQRERAKGRDLLSSRRQANGDWSKDPLRGRLPTQAQIEAREAARAARAKIAELARV
jgi:hypothetical protein